jgi:cell division protein FtsL
MARAAAATAAPAVPRRAPRRAPATAPKRPRRVSGRAAPAKRATPAPRRAPGRATPAPRRAPGRATPAQRPAAAQRALALPRGARILDRLLTGRVWIGLVGVLLAGIVFFNVDLMRINREITHMADRAAQLKRENGRLRMDEAGLANSERIQEAAAELGLVLPAPAEVRYLKSKPATDARLASKRVIAPEPTEAPDPLATETPTADAETGTTTGATTDPTTGVTLDPATGLPVDPETGVTTYSATGQPIDPTTGQPIDTTTTTTPTAASPTG